MMLRCWRTIKRHDLTRYVTNELPPERVRCIEEHLLDCGDCRDRVVRLRDGQRLASQLPSITPERDVWAAIEAAIEGRDTRPARDARAAGRLVRWHNRLGDAHFAWAALALALMLCAVMAVLHHHKRLEPEELKSLEAADWGDFHPVRIDNIESNTKSHIVAEGYVSEVSFDDEDGDMHFKLVDNPGDQEGRFIVCEIIDPIKLVPPTVGSHVRVYGVSRYDGERDHQWYEVHPVLNIEAVR